MPKEVTVSLGGRSFTVATLPIEKSRVWRDKLAIPFGTLAHALTSASTVEIDQLADIAELLQNMSGVLLGSVDLMLGLMYDYSEELRQEKDWIEKNAYDEEALVAFGEVLKLAYPFGVLLGVVTGRMGQQTLLSLQRPNGGSTLPASGPKRKDKST